MALKTDLQADVAAIFNTKWASRDGLVVPSDQSIKLGNDAVKLRATVLFADMADSTALTDQYKDWFAAEIYKTFLHCAAKIIKSEGGTITAYDGDRVMAVYIGDMKNTAAVRTALKIHYAVRDIINPAKRSRYTENLYTLKHVIGIDTSDLFVAKTGVRGANDLVWVGRAANYASKLAALPETHPTYITEEVYNVLHASVKQGPLGRAMWERVRWNTFDNRSIYRSNWYWPIE